MDNMSESYVYSNLLYPFSVILREGGTVDFVYVVELINQVTISSFPTTFSKALFLWVLNPLPDMPILSSSSSADDIDMTSKTWTNRDSVIWFCRKTLWEKEKLLVTSNFSFSYNGFKSCLLLMNYNEYLWSKGLKQGNYLVKERSVNRFICKIRYLVI